MNEGLGGLMGEFTPPPAPLALLPSGDVALPYQRMQKQDALLEVDPALHRHHYCWDSGCGL